MDLQLAHVERIPRPALETNGSHQSLPKGKERTGNENIYNLNTLLVTQNIVFHSLDFNIQAFSRREDSEGRTEMIKVYNGHHVFVTCIRYYDFVLYTGAQDSTIISWSVVTGKPLNFYNGHTDAISSLHVDHVGYEEEEDCLTRIQGRKDYLWSSSWDGTVCCWSLSSNRIKKRFEIGSAPVEKFVVHKGLLYAGSGSTFRVFHIASAALVADFQDCAEQLHHSIAIDAKRKLLVTGGNTLSVWDLPVTQQSQVQVVAEFTEFKAAAARRESKSSEDDEFFNSARHNRGWSSIYEVRAGPRVLANKINHIIFRRDSGICWSGHADGSVRLWNLLSRDDSYELPKLHTGAITSMLLYKGRMCTGSTDRTVRVWNTREGVCESVLLGHKSEISCIKKKFGRLYTSSLDGDVRKWNISEDAVDVIPELLYKGSASFIKELCVDGNFIFSCNDLGFVMIWNHLESKMEVEFRAAIQPCTRLAVSLDTLFVASGQVLRKYSIQAIKERFQQQKEQRGLEDNQHFVFGPMPEFEFPFDRPVIDLVTFGREIIFVSTDQEIYRINVVNNLVTAFNQRGQSGHTVDGAIRIDVGPDTLYSVCAQDKSLIAWDFDGKLLGRFDKLPSFGTYVYYHSFYFQGKMEHFLPKGKAKKESAITTSEKMESMSGSALNLIQHEGQKNMIFVATGDASLQELSTHRISAYDADNMQPSKTIRFPKFHTNTITKLVCKGAFIYASSADCSVAIYYAPTGSLFWVLRNHTEAVGSLDIDDHNVLHSACYRIVSVEINLLVNQGLTVKYDVGCGSCGLFGSPLEVTEVKSEDTNIANRKQQENKGHVVKKSFGARTSVFQHRMSASTVRGDEGGGNVAFAPQRDIREFDSPADKLGKRTLAYIDLYFFRYFFLLIEFFQMFSFAFTIGMGVQGFDPRALVFGANGNLFAVQYDSPWHNSGGWLSFLQGVQSFALSTTSYDSKLVTSVIIVFLFWMVIFAQEALETARFLNPSNQNLRRLWRLTELLIKVFAVPLYMPVMLSFILAYSCSTDVNGSLVWNVDVAVVCYQGAHTARCAVAMFGMVFYTILTLRMVRVGNDLKNLDVQANPLNFSNDVVNKNFTHPLSLNSTVPDLLTMIGKPLLVIIAVTCINNRQLQGVLSLAIAGVVWASSFVWPVYFDRHSNAGRAVINTCSLVFYIAALVGQVQREGLGPTETTDVSYYILILVIGVAPGSYYLFRRAEYVMPWYTIKNPANLEYNGSFHHGRVAVVANAADAELEVDVESHILMIGRGPEMYQQLVVEIAIGRY